MLKSYLGLQQEALDAMGKERVRLRESALREEQRAIHLQQTLVGLTAGAATFHPLLWQNRQQMDHQLRQLLTHQAQQATLARLDLERHEQQLRAHVGRVKGLELVLAQREQAQRQQAERRDQCQLDELSGLRHRARQGQ